MLLIAEYDIGELSSEPKKKYMIHMKIKYRPKDIIQRQYQTDIIASVNAHSFDIRLIAKSYKQ